MSEVYRRHIKLEHRLLNGQTVEIWTDSGKDILDSVSGEPVMLEVKADQEGNVRLFDASVHGAQRPSLLIPINGPFHEDGRPQLIPDCMLNEAVQVFADRLQSWEDMAPLDTAEGIRFHPHSPPGLCEAPPGVPYRHSRSNKPDDFREARSKDYGDGTEMHEYNGRHNGTPFIAHEITTYTGLILARYVEYDQPQKIVFVDDYGVINQIDDVLVIDSEFRPDTCVYMTEITTNRNSLYTFGGFDDAPL